MHSVLGGRLPEGCVLSHDLLEGSLARCAAVTDITVIEDAPFHADVAASRVHRWTRGDWQLLPFLLQPWRWRLRGVNRWKMVDNLRRSLVAPMSLALLAFALATGIVEPLPMLVLIVLAFSAGPLMGALAALSPSRDDIAYGHFYRQALADLGRALAGGAWLVAQLLQMALRAADAVVLALWRMVVTRRHLLEWTTAAEAQAAATTQLPALLRKHWAAPLFAATLLAAMLALRTPYPGTALVLCIVWALSPLWTWWVSRPRPLRTAEALSIEDRAYLADVGRDTWRLFERCVTPAEHDLPPDNLQTMPSDMVAHRTSPTNIGLYLLCTMCAHRFGWIGTVDTVARIEATLKTMASLERHRGHFLNWYDTTSMQALLPMYVSTVDSGNLCTHLLAVAEAALEMQAAPFEAAPLRTGLIASAQRVAHRRAACEQPLTGTATLQLLAIDDLLGALESDPRVVRHLVDAAVAETVAAMPLADAEAEAAALPRPNDRLAWAVLDHIATVRSALHDVEGA
ncbi:MAG: carbohydrate-binding protein, partial [Caldimonas sp.]